MDIKQNNEELLKWAQKETRNIINVTIAEFPDMGYGLKATKPIKRNEIALSIHKNYFLSLDNCFNDKFMKEKVYPKGKTLNIYQKFILFLWKEISLGKDSKYVAYFESLPRNITNVLLWSKEAIDVIQRNDLKQYIINKQKKIESEYNALVKFIEEQDIGKTLKPWTLNDYLWLYTVIESRAISLPSKYDLHSDVGALIPVYDFANHDFLYEGEPSLEEQMKDLKLTEEENKQRRLISQQDYFFFDVKKNSYILKAHRDYNEGDQVFIMYSGKPNPHFVDYYGFVSNRNPNNSVTYKISLKEDDRLKYFSNCFNGEFANKLNICHSLLPQIVYKQTPPGYIEGIEMRKKVVFALVDTFEVEVEEKSHDLSWQTKTFLKIFSLPNDACLQFLHIKKKHDHDDHDHDEHEHDDEEDEEEGEEEEEEKEEEVKETKEEKYVEKKYRIDDLMNEDYFYDSTHERNYKEMVYRLAIRMREELYGKLKKEDVENMKVNDIYAEVAKSFVVKELDILGGFIRNISK